MTWIFLACSLSMTDCSRLSVSEQQCKALLVFEAADQINRCIGTKGEVVGRQKVASNDGQPQQ